MDELIVEYDWYTDVITIEGMRYSGDLFREFGGGLAVGEYFQLIERKDGLITIRRLSPIRVLVREILSLIYERLWRWKG